MAGHGDGVGSAPWLVLDRVERDQQVPTRWVGALRVAGHPLRIVLDFGRPGLAEYVEMPELLGMHDPSMGAVVRAMSRIESGETVPLPYDLTDEIRDADPPFPLRPLGPAAQARLDAAADAVDLSVQSIERSSAAPQLVQADLVVDGRPINIRVRLYTQPGAVPVMRWLHGPGLADLTEAQGHAIRRALLADAAPGAT